MKTDYDKLIEQIKKGAFKDSYLIYNRKSTDEENSQKNSISYQKAETTKYADAKGLQIAQFTINGLCSDGIISERHSGYKEKGEMDISENGEVTFQIARPKFQRLVHFLSKGYFKGMICLCWDRISRNKADDTIIRRLMKKGIDIQFVYAQYDDSSSGELHMDIDGMFSQHHSRVTSEKVRLATRDARKEGFCTYKAPIGYLNTGDIKKKPFDPVRAPIIKRLFLRYATDNHSVADITRFAQEQGLMTVPKRRKRTKEELLSETQIIIEPKTRLIGKSQINKILKSPFYVGKIKGNDGVYIQSKSHKALISEEVFNRVQAILEKKNVSIYFPLKKQIPLRGLLRCNGCNRVYTPYEKKGNIYLASKCKTTCSNSKKSINAQFVYSGAWNIFSEISFSDIQMKQLRDNLDKDMEEYADIYKTKISETQAGQSKVNKELIFLQSNKIELLSSGAYSPIDYAEQEISLIEKVAEYSVMRGESIEQTEILRGDVVKFSELLNRLIYYYENAIPEEKEEILRFLFSELSVSDMGLTYIAHTDLEVINLKTAYLCAHEGAFSELVSRGSLFQKSCKLILAFINRLTN